MSNAESSIVSQQIKRGCDSNKEKPNDKRQKTVYNRAANFRRKKNGDKDDEYIDLSR